MARIGIVSDTHGLLRPEALEALRGSDWILHAGDVGASEVIETLRTVAPVYAVRGNNDVGPWAMRLPLSMTLSYGGLRMHLVHDVHDLRLDPQRTGITVVVSGHSHKPSIVERDGVLWVNPGSAGPRRFRLPVTIALLRLEAPTSAEIVPLL